MSSVLPMGNTALNGEKSLYVSRSQSSFGGSPGAVLNSNPSVPRISNAASVELPRLSNAASVESSAGTSIARSYKAAG